MGKESAVIRNALVGILLSGLTVLALLFGLGFRPAELAALTDPACPEAVRNGEFLAIGTVWVEGESLQREHRFAMTLRNPTNRVLRLTGSWQASAPGVTVQAAAPSDATVELVSPPGGTASLDLVLRLLPGAGGEERVVAVRPPVFQGTLHWAAWTGPGKSEHAAALSVPVERPLEIRRAFGTVNYAVLGLYLAGMLAIGVAAGRKIKDTRGFFIAGGRLHYMVVGLSILGTYLSALTMMGLPGMSYGKHDWTFMVQLPCLVITAMVITGVVLPRYRALGIISIYQFLEERIHVSLRVVAALSFILFSIGRMGLVLYLPALAFSTVTGAPLSLCIIGMGMIITLYTVVGGMEAVVWTDAIQVVIFLGGALFTLGYLFYGGMAPGDFVAMAQQHDKFRILIPGFDVTQITTAWLVLETIFQTIRIYGTQQDVAQRYLTTESTEKASRAVWFGILAYIPLGFIFYFIGTALFAFYKLNPAVNLPGKADPMYPHFIVHHLPVGVAGLVIAAIFAAAMSSIDSCMNSASTICIEDFAKRFGRAEKSDGEHLRAARLLTLLWGALAVGMGLLFMEVEYAQIVWGKLMGIATNGMLGLMALAFLPWRIDKWAALTGFAASYAVLFVLMSSSVCYLLWPVVGNTVCFLVGMLSSSLFSREGRAGNA